MAYTGLGSMQPVVIDTLVTLFQAMTVPASTAIVDGYPGSYEPTVIVSVGGGMTDPSADGAQEWAYLGAKTKWDRFHVVVVCSVLLGGNDGASAPETTADEQKTVRDLAYTVVHACEAVITGDPTLGGIFLKGGWAGVADVRLVQTDEQTAAQGAHAEVHMTVQVDCLI